MSCARPAFATLFGGLDPDETGDESYDEMHAEATSERATTTAAQRRCARASVRARNASARRCWRARRRTRPLGSSSRAPRRRPTKCAPASTLSSASTRASSRRARPSCVRWARCDNDFCAVCGPRVTRPFISRRTGVPRPGRGLLVGRRGGLEGRRCRGARPRREVPLRSRSTRTRGAPRSRSHRVRNGPWKHAAPKSLSTTRLWRHARLRRLPAAQQQLAREVSPREDSPPRVLVHRRNCSRLRAAHSQSVDVKSRRLPRQRHAKRPVAPPMTSPSLRTASCVSPAPLRVVLPNCGHLVVCASCGSGLALCPMCRAPVHDRRRVFVRKILCCVLVAQRLLGATAVVCAVATAPA